jgi:hypothetical protein
VTELLVVLNPRAIGECMAAINGLPIPTCWVRYMPEPLAAKAIHEVVARTRFDRYVLLSDDTIPTPAALDAVLAAHDEHGGVVTGWCNVDSRLPWANVTRNVLPPPPPTVDSYDMLTRTEVLDGPAVFETTFAGLCLTVVPRPTMRRHPLRVSRFGGQMDYMLSYDLAGARVPIRAVRAGFVWHVKEEWNEPDGDPRKRLLIGERPATIEFSRMPAAAGATA